jgi:Flp pilus assembly protein TadG
MILRNPTRRSAATAVEMAIIAPVFVFLLFALVIGGLGIFRYNQVAHLARQAARYAAVHGNDYHTENKKPAATQASILAESVLPNANALDASRLTCTVTWDQTNAPKQYSATGKATNNTVIVTVSYQWLPEAMFGGGTLTSTSKMPMSY